MAISKITRIYVRRYSDTGQVTAYVEWVNRRGQVGRTEATVERVNHPRYPGLFTFGPFMHAAMRAASDAGLRLQREVW